MGGYPCGKREVTRGCQAYLVTGNVDEILLLPFQLDGLLHASLLEILCPLLLTDVGETAKDALQGAIRRLLGIGRGEHPGVTLGAVARFPGCLEPELAGDGNVVMHHPPPHLRHRLSILVLDRLEPSVGLVLALGQFADLVPGFVEEGHMPFAVGHEDPHRRQFRQTGELGVALDRLLRPRRELLRQLDPVHGRQSRRSFASLDLFVEQQRRRETRGQLSAQHLHKERIVVVVRSSRVDPHDAESHHGLAGGGEDGTDDDRGTRLVKATRLDALQDVLGEVPVA